MSPEGIRPGRNAILERIGSERWNGPDNAPIVFSSEDFSLAALKPESSVKFAELADSFQTELILTHRPIAHRVYSFIQEHVKHGNLDNAFDGTEISWEHLLKMKFFRHDYFARMVGMGKWMKCHVVVVDKTRAYFLREAFSSILGVPLDGTGDPGMLNQSMPYMQMRILYGLHREGYAGGIEERLEKSTEMFERLRDTDPEKAATPYPPIPRHVLRRMEEMDAELELSLSELERCGRLIVHRPDGA